MKKGIENKTRAVSVFALLVVLMTSSAHGSERDSLAKVTEFTKKSNVFSILKARDKTEIGIALGNYRRTNKTDVMFLFPGIVCTGQFKGIWKRATELKWRWFVTIELKLPVRIY